MVKVRPKSPFDRDLIAADFETFNIYYKRKVWLALEDILHDRNMLVRVANAIQKFHLAIAKTLTGQTLPDPRSTILAAQKMIEEMPYVVRYAVREEDGLVVAEFEMPRRFLLAYQLTNLTSVPFVAPWFSEKMLQETFQTLVKGYFDPKRQPYDVVEITFDPGGDPANGTS